MNVMICLKSRLLGEGLYELLTKEGRDIDVILRDQCEHLAVKPDLVLVDARSICEEAVASWRDVKMILIDTGLTQEEVIPLLITYKLHGVLSTSADAALLRKALRLVHEGQIWIDNDSLKALVFKAGSFAKNESIEKVSRREHQIIEHIVQGRTNREIATRLFISEQTVKAHMSRIFKKFKVPTRTRLIASLLRNEGLSSVRNVGAE